MCDIAQQVIYTCNSNRTKTAQMLNFNFPLNAKIPLQMRPAMTTASTSSYRHDRDF